ncbi:MAG: penicillin acylase family protein, partial [Proteobacteria bacterium]|nr:penicillin acylase family protein [Pseudomonadota bacterium]
ILDLLDGGPQSLDTTADIQRDTLSLMARHLLPLILDIDPAGDRERRVLGLLAKWDGVMARHRPEPLIFAAWMRELNRAVYADELGTLFPSFWGFRPAFTAFVLTRRGEWCDDVRTSPVEDCKSRIAAALEAALDQLAGRFGEGFEDWRWGDMHRARFRHRIFTGLPVLGRFADLAIATDGGAYTVNRGASRVADAETPFADIHGPGYRAIYDLSDLAQSRFMIATGQSGNPLSSHYGDLLRDWRDGRYMRLGRERGDLEAAAEGVFRLVPPAPPATQ